MTAGSDVCANSSTGCLFENTTDVGFAQKEIFSQLFHGKGLADILVDVGQDIVHLMTVFVGGIGNGLCIGIGEGVTIITISSIKAACSIMSWA